MNVPPKIRGAFVWRGGMAIDADGARQAYRLDGEGLDDLANARNKSGKFVGVVVRDGKPVETPDGALVSTTALQDKTKAPTDPARYVDAASVPYLAICPELRDAGVKLGDLAVVVRGTAVVGLICADICPHGHYGECSIAAAPGVGLSGSPRIGGTDDGCVFVVFPGTAKDPAWPRAVVEFQQAAFDAFDAWGGLVAAKGC